MTSDVGAVLVGYQHGPITLGESREGMVTPCSNKVASWLKINKRAITLISDDIVVEREVSYYSCRKVWALRPVVLEVLLYTFLVS